MTTTSENFWLMVRPTARRLESEHVADFVTPERRVLLTGKPWAADNGCFQGFDEAAYVSMLDWIGAQATKPLWVTLPDVVGNYRETLHRFGRWHRELAARNLPRAFVLQDGCEGLGWNCIPWDYIEAVFIGGSTAFKLGPTAAALARVARSLGKWVHMGRVNSVLRMHYAQAIGCHSCDGSGMAKFQDDVLAPMVRDLDRLQFARTNQLTLRF